MTGVILRLLYGGDLYGGRVVMQTTNRLNNLCSGLVSTRVTSPHSDSEAAKGARRQGEYGSKSGGIG